MSQQLRRQIKLTNSVVLLLILIALMLLFPIVFEDGWGIGAKADVLSIFLLISLIALNHKGFYNFSRIVASTYPSFITMVASILIKHYN